MYVYYDFEERRRDETKDINLFNKDEKLFSNLILLFY